MFTSLASSLGLRRNNEDRPSLFHSAQSAASTSLLPTNAMSLVLYADIAHLRHSLQLVAANAETLQRILTHVPRCRSSEREIDQSELQAVQQLLRLLALTQASNTQLADCVLAELEQPLVHDLELLNAAATQTQRKNDARLEQLTDQLKQSEAASQKARKQKQRDLVVYQQSLHVLNGIAMEIKRIEQHNVICGDELAERRLPFVLERCAAVTKQLSTGYAGIAQGIKDINTQIQAAAVSRGMLTQLPPSPIHDDAPSDTDDESPPGRRHHPARHSTHEVLANDMGGMKEYF
ncbi:hypothetical protein RI367_004081 [Sorochytrium milnesiophthora]